MRNLTMVTNVPFYSFKDVSRHERTLSIVHSRTGHRRDQYPPTVLFSLFFVVMA
jgi:hypothetical protein